jgi:hypothetical protein
VLTVFTLGENDTDTEAMAQILELISETGKEEVIDAV